MFVPILAVSEALCSGVVVCLIFSLPFILQYVPYVLAVIFLIAASISWWKVRWSRITITLLVLALLSAATLIPHYWSVYQQKMTIERNAQNTKAEKEAIIKNANFQLFQPPTKISNLSLISFYPSKVSMQLESGAVVKRATFQAVYENGQKQQLLITYVSGTESPEKTGWGCSKNGSPLQQYRKDVTCQKQGLLSDKAVVYRQDYDADSEKYIYSTIRNDVSFITGATTIKPEDVSSIFDGFTPVDRDKLSLVEAK